MERNWVLASRNAGKVREIRALLAGFGITLQSLDSIAEAPAVVEDGDTFLDNARKKAWTIARFTGQVVLADDSGLEVDALGGEPGVHSARYADLSKSENSTDDANNRRLLEKLSGVAAEKRTARYRAVLVLADPHRQKDWVFEGACEGRIGFEPRGQDGFGYDPYFLLLNDKRTMAEIALDEKNRLSHRGKALRQLVAALPEILEMPR